MARNYSHVIVIGVDGAGAWFENVDTPNFDEIFKNGAVTHNAVSSKPTISAECWASMLIGVGPEVHKLNNNIISTTPYDLNSPFPTIFKRIRTAYPDAKLGCYCDWNPITYGIVENTLGVSHDTARDVQLTPIVCDYIRKTQPDFLFIHFDSVDGAGHKYGYGLNEHKRSIHLVDKLIGDIYNTILECDMADDTLFMVIADHGGTNDENLRGSHGGWTDQEKYVTFAAVGKTVNQTKIQEMNIRDLAAIVLYAMGISLPQFCENGWTSQVPEGLFADPQVKEYKDISHLTGAAPRISKKQHTSEIDL